MGQLHTPVMLKEVLSFATPLLRNDGFKVAYLDGTFGRGGHLKAILEIAPEATAVGLDRDLEAIEYGRKEMENWVANDRLKLIHANYSEYENLNIGPFDFVLLDLGVSSPQLDNGPRGFSFYHEGPLDMRMNQTEGFTAADIINGYAENDLARIFIEFGEVRRPFRVINAIVTDRKTKPFVSTRDLAGLIERVDGWHRKGHHPATQYFQALRIEVNKELETLEAAIIPIIKGLKPRGRLAVLTFHSLEDRIVKNIFKSSDDLGKNLTKKVLQAEWAEAKDNSRARSAKLRVFERQT
jgi:16S rRNA (cytosine1402-N4)-methyltransferase